MKVTISCPYCKQQYTTEDFQEGVEVECSVCKKSFLLSKSLIINSPMQTSKGYNNPMKTANPAKIKQNQGKTQQEGNDFKRPVIAIVLDIVSLLAFIGAIFGLVGYFADSKTSDYSHASDYISLFGRCLLVAFISMGFAQLAIFVAEIRYHSKKQTKLLADILAKLSSHE